MFDESVNDLNINFNATGNVIDASARQRDISKQSKIPIRTPTRKRTGSPNEDISRVDICRNVSVMQIKKNILFDDEAASTSFAPVQIKTAKMMPKLDDNLEKKVKQRYKLDLSMFDNVDFDYAKKEFAKLKFMMTTDMPCDDIDESYSEKPLYVPSKTTELRRTIKK